MDNAQAVLNNYLLAISAPKNAILIASTTPIFVVFFIEQFDPIKTK